MAGSLIGRECKLYYNAGSYTSPTWTEITRVVDANADISKSYGDVSSRASQWEMKKPALKSLKISFGYRYRQGVTDAVFDALRAAALADTPTELAIADGAIATAGNEYLRAYCDLAMGIDQPLSDGVLANFDGELTYYEDSGTLREPSYNTAS